MKNLFIILIAVVTVLASCTSGTQTQNTEAVAEEVTATYAIDAENSVVAWSGEVAGVYGHNGVINVSEGNVTTSNGKLTGGKVVIDMMSIQPLDSASYKDEDGRRASDLVGHLGTDDFFLTASFPTSSFVIKSQNGNELIGDLTVKGITKEEKATIKSLEVTPEGLNASAELVFNRQDYKVSWVHFMKDMILSDDIKINLQIVGKSN